MLWWCGKLCSISSYYLPLKLPRNINSKNMALKERPCYCFQMMLLFSSHVSYQLIIFISRHVFLQVWYHLRIICINLSIAVSCYIFYSMKGLGYYLMSFLARQFLLRVRCFFPLNGKLGLNNRKLSKKEIPQAVKYSWLFNSF